MATRPLQLRIGYDRIDDEHRRAEQARLSRDLREASGREGWILRTGQAAAAWAARVAGPRRTGTRGTTTARPG